MHSLLDRGTILAGLVDELRPLLPPLGAALGDLCAGVGQAEAAEKVLDTAFMIRAAAEMLELSALAEAGGLIEEIVPVRYRSTGPVPSRRPAGGPVATVGPGAGTDALTNSGLRPGCHSSGEG